METPVVVGIGEVTSAVAAFGARAGPSRVERAGGESVGKRLIRVAGRTVLRLPPSTWLLLDVCILVTGVYVAFLAFPPFDTSVTPHVALWQAEAVFAFGVIVASLVFGLWERDTFMSRSRTLTRMILATATATVLAYALIYVVMYATVGRRVSAVAMGVFLGGGVAMRLAARWAVRQIHCGLLVVGSRGLFESFEEAQLHGFLHEYRLTGYATIDEAAAPVPRDRHYLGPIVRKVGDLSRWGVTDVVVADGVARDPRVMQWVVPCLQHGCRVTNEATFYEKATGQILVDQITPAWFLFADLKGHCDEQATLKRLMDLVIAGLALLVTTPFWPVIALAIKLVDGGPVFYSQDRVGQNGKVFRLYKFRTMRTGAENGKSVWCAPNDPRVTPVGRLLRRTRLDELPQFYNVLIGQMSVVGPRPERPDLVGELSGLVPYYPERHLVKPGITGWAQISFRYGNSIEDAKRKLQFDLYYLKHISFELDMIILFRTLGTFLRGAC